MNTPFVPTATEKRHLYRQACERIHALTEGESDAIAIMATIVAELHHTLPHFQWTGFYRVTRPGLLKVGPYQGGHGCLSIPFSRGVCGRAATELKTQVVEDVHAIAWHIACSSRTQSEIVLPLISPDGRLIAVLDIDSDLPAAFNEVDQDILEAACREWAAAMKL